MKKIVFAKKTIFAGLVLVLMENAAFASCIAANSRVNVDVLSGMRITAVSPGGEPWVEEHCPGSKLVKVGSGPASPTNTVDPSVVVGTWAENPASGTPARTTVTYNYTRHGSAGPYTFTLRKNASSPNYFFCNGAAVGAPLVATGTLSTASNCGAALPLPPP